MEMALHAVALVVRLAWLRWSYPRQFEHATFPGWWCWVHCPVVPRTGQNKGSPVVWSKPARREFPTGETPDMQETVWTLRQAWRCRDVINSFLLPIIELRSIGLTAQKRVYDLKYTEILCLQVTLCTRNSVPLPVISTLYHTHTSLPKRYVVVLNRQNNIMSPVLKLEAYSLIRYLACLSEVTILYRYGLIRHKIELPPFPSEMFNYKRINWRLRHMLDLNEAGTFPFTWP
jgi:hypothetical protein